MIDGLEEAAKRAEKSEQREEQRRKGGGGINATEALHVDDTGKKWSRMVMLTICLSVMGLAGLAGTLIYLANRETRDPREMSARSRSMLSEYVIISQKMKQFKSDETITVDAVKARFAEVIDADIKAITDEIERERSRREEAIKKDHKQVNTPKRTLGLGKEREDKEQLRAFIDPMGKPFVFTLPDSETLQITAPQIPKTDPIDAVTMRLRAGAKK